MKEHNIIVSKTRIEIVTIAPIGRQRRTSLKLLQEFSTKFHPLFSLDFENAISNLGS